MELKLDNAAKTIEYTVGKHGAGMNNPYGVVLATWPKGGSDDEQEYITWGWCMMPNGKVSCFNGEYCDTYPEAKDAYRKRANRI